MQWMQSEFAFGDQTITKVIELVADLHLVKSGLDRKVSFAFGLWSRDLAYETTVLLISPEVSAYVDRLPGNWTVSGPEHHQWAMLYGDARTSELLGVTTATAGS